jgi:tetratricopeptide (TPR) repeat protein
MWIRIAGVVCLLISILIGTALADPDTLSLLTQGREAAKAGDLTKAERYHRLAVSNAEHNGDPAELAQAIGDLGGILLARGQLTEARELCLKSRAMLLEIKSTHYLPVVLNNLGVISMNTGNYAQSEAYFKDSLKTVRSFARPDPYEARVLNNLGAFYYATKDLDKAEKALKNAISIVEKQLGADRVEIAPLLSNLAGIYVVRKKWSSAGPLLDRALKLLKVSTPPDNVNLAGVLDNLGMMHHLQKNNVESEKLLRQAYDLRVALFGPEAPVVIATAVKLAGALRDLARYAEAEKLYNDALANYEKTSRLNTAEGATALEEFARLLRRTDREKNAEHLESTARTIRFDIDHTISAASLR